MLWRWICSGDTWYQRWKYPWPCWLLTVFWNSNMYSMNSRKKLVDTIRSTFSAWQKTYFLIFLTVCNLTRKFHVFLKFKSVLDNFTEQTCRYNPASDLSNMTKKLLCNFFNCLQFDEKISCLSEIQICIRWFHGKNLSIQFDRLS